MNSYRRAPNARGSLRIGCCGWARPQTEYFRSFSVIEVQQTFYQPPRLETLARWRQDAPPDFEFTLKAWQLITHEPTSPTYKRLKISIPQKKETATARSAQPKRYTPRGEQRSMARERSARESSCFSARLHLRPPLNVDNLRDFFVAAHREASDLVLAWEPRGQWADTLVKALCAELHLLHVVDPFVQQSASPSPRYFRLHGIRGYHSGYSDADLDRLATWCRGETYVLFNNRNMAKDALRFRMCWG